MDSFSADRNILPESLMCPQSAPIVGHLDRYLGLGGHLPLDDTRLLDEGPQIARVGQHRSLQKEVGIYLHPVSGAIPDQACKQCLIM